MKKYINRIFVVASCALAMASCDDNSWNDKLDGFDPDQNQGTAETINYTLSAQDYKQLASLSANKTLAGDELASALAAVGNQGYFTDQITPMNYLPAFLSQETFPYFALPNNSTVKVTYNIAVGLPEEVSKMAAAQTYTVSADDYMTAWGSDENYAEAFAPSCTASRNIPKILTSAYPDAEAGDYVVVGYQQAATDPVFSATTPEEPKFEMSSVLGSLTTGSTVDIKGVVTAVSTQGPVITDASGSVFCYNPTNKAELNIGDQVDFSATVSSYNYGFQLAAGATCEVVGKQEVTYPTAKTWTGAEIDAFVAEKTASGASLVSPVFSKFTGTVAISGNYINIILDGTTVQVSPYGIGATAKAQLTNGATVELEGYVVALASKGKFFNTIITKIGSTPVVSTASVKATATSRAATAVASTAENAVYTFNGTTWSAAANTLALNHSDYQLMGQKYDNLSGTLPASLLPIYLQQKFPYAQIDQVEYVVYNYYNGSATNLRCDQFTYTAEGWTVNNGVATETSQFVKKNGKWLYSPDVVITLPAGKGIAISTLYYQTCVDWVATNVPDGSAYVSSYGNNEYYCGTSAYQGNVDLRPSAARTQNPDAYDSMTDEQIVALEKQRFETEVFPGALAILHADAAPVSGIFPTFTINFFYYDGTTQAATIIYSVTAPGRFEFVSCTWND